MTPPPFAHETWVVHGHFPADWSFAFRAMLVLLVYGSDAARRPVVSAWWPWGPSRGIATRSVVPAVEESTAT